MLRDRGICGTHLRYKWKHTRWNQNRPIIKLTPNSERNVLYLSSVSFLGFELVVPSFLNRFSFPPPPPQRETEKERERERERRLSGSSAEQRKTTSLKDMAAPEAPLCYVGVAKQSAAFRLMKQMVLPLSLSLSLENLNSTVFDLILCLFIYIGLGRRRRAW